MSLPSYSAVTSESVFLDEEFADEQTEGDPEFLLELVGDLVEDAESQMDVLEQVLTPEELDYQQALKEKTLDAWVSAAHTLKGAALQIGFKTLGKQSEIAEMTGRAILEAVKEGKADNDLLTAGSLRDRLKVAPTTLGELKASRRKIYDKLAAEYAKVKQWRDEQEE
eukprot:TRINITY_DN66418_c7_g1_i1.p1 TRINITY_DN66418_c7_g1~~TRINITY_DN66418_c7_g1_i1.p1  ORF type:complete len:167 (+),score=91.75 TRINITY_DN66418_c7_g1_i1:181-681(+)